MSGFDGIGGLGMQQPHLVGEGLAARQDGPERPAAKGGFGSAMAEALQNVDRLGKDAKSKAEALARGEPVEVHDVMIAAGKSEVAFNLMLEIRNKLLDAWQTLERAVV